MSLIKNISQNLQHATTKKIIFSESEDERILQACMQLHHQKLIQPILIGDAKQIAQRLQQLNIDNTIAIDDIEIINPKTSSHLPLFAEQLYEKRKAKGMTIEQAQTEVINPLSFSYLMLNNDFADGTVNGAVNTTAEVVKKAIQIIGLAPDSKIVSSFFLMSKSNTADTLIFADCALVVEPDAEQLSHIAFDTIHNAQKFLTSAVKVAMLSFSTQGSAEHPEAQKVSAATQLLKKQLPQIAIDGEIQFDAAIVPSIATKKYQQSQTQGAANVFIFPNLSAANIGYKIAQRLAGYQAIGPILQGLNKPANDLSRGCNVDDIINLALITAS